VREESRWSALGSRGDQPPRAASGPRSTTGHAPPDLRPGPKPRLLAPLTGPTHGRFVVWTLWIMRWTSVEDANRAAPLTIAAGPSAAAAVATMIRAMASENLARQAIPRLIPTPTAICPATSTDALFLGTTAENTAFTTQATTASHRESPRPPRGAIPLLSSRAVDSGDKGFHRLWITLTRRPVAAHPAWAVNAAWAVGHVRGAPTRAPSSASSGSASPLPPSSTGVLRLGVSRAAR
jgi:hypothetical protein